MELQGLNMVNRDIGFSLWLDFIERDYLKNEFPKLIKQGVINGATSNPAIFASAITTSAAYKEQLATLEGKSAKDKYEALAITDIKIAAQALRGLYDDDNDGYISIEVDPFLSDDTEGTVAEGIRLFEAIGEPNVMIKVPATEAGYKAMTLLMSRGISVNATLVFSPAQARKCIKAMNMALEGATSKVDAVISVFVSRFDRLLDAELEQEAIKPLKTGIYNAAKIYNLVEENMDGRIKTLFASTGVKDSSLRADYYIHGLMAAYSINTAPLATIESYVSHKRSPEALPIEDDVIDGYFTKLSDHGFDIEEISDGLMRDGLVAFEQAFTDMLDSIK